jgi:hypothetical protein
MTVKCAPVERPKKYVNMAWRFQDMQEEPKYDEWGMPVPSDESPTQKRSPTEEFHDLPF